MTDERTERAHRLWPWMLPVLLLTMWLGAMYINSDPLWGDERNTVQSTGGVFTPQLYPLPQVWWDVADAHPEQLPEYQTLANLWMRLVGTEPAAIRALSLFIGCLGVACVYRLGVYVTASERVGLYAALLCGTSILIVHYLIRVRTYSLLVTLTAVVLLLYLIAVNQPHRRRSGWFWFGLAAGTAGLLYTHYLVLLFFAAIGLQHLLLLPQARRSWIRRWWRVVFAFAAGGLVFLLWLPSFLHGLGVEARTYDDVGLNAGQSLTLFLSYFGNGLTLLSVVAILLVVITRGGARLGQVKLITAVTGVLLLVFFVVSNRLHQTRPAYLIGLWPLLVVPVAAALVRREQAGGWQRIAARALLLVFVVGGIRANIVRDANDRMENFRTIFPVHVVDLLLRQRDIVGDRVVVELPDDLTNREDKMSRIAVESARVDLKATSYRLIRGSDPAAVIDNFSPLPDLLKWRRLWVAYMPDRPTSARDAFARTLATNFRQCPVSLQTSQVKVDQYAQSMTCCLDPDSQAQVARFGDGIALMKAGLPSNVVAGPVAIDLLWALRPDVPPETYSISLQWFDAQGNKAGQQDFGLDTGAYPCQHADLDWSSLQPGVYTVSVAVYNWRDGQRLPAIAEGGAPPDNLVPMGTVTVS